jgi:uncharacterized membrane protein
MLWFKALHLIFMVTWFAGLSFLIPDTGLPVRIRGRLHANKVRMRSHSLRERALILKRENSPCVKQEIKPCSG